MNSILQYTNEGATRSLPLIAPLESRISEAVSAVYGPGYVAQVYSGGQPGKGSGGKRVGSVRHDHGKAADVYVVGPDGKRVTGDALAPLGQYWAAKRYGGVGLEMRGGGIHLDAWEKPPAGGGMHWNYAGEGGRYTDAMRSAMEAGLRGELPSLTGGGTTAVAQAGGFDPSAFGAIALDGDTPAAPTANAAAQATERMAAGAMAAPATPAPLPTARPGYQVQRPSEPVPFDPVAAGATPFDPVAAGAQPAERSPQHLDFDGSNVEGYNPETGMVERTGPLQAVDSAVRGVADAATFGFADEISAGLGAVTGVGGEFGDYSGNLERQRATDAQRREENPLATIGGQIAGGVATGVIAAPAAAASLGGRIAQGAALGAGAGGAYGFGSGEGVEGRARNALSGLAVGATVGGVMPAAGTGLRKGYNALMDATARPAANALRSTVAPQRNALGLVQRSLARDGLTPDMAAGKMREATAAGDDSMMLVDVAGDNTRRLGRFATNIPGEGANEIKDKVFERQLAQPDRVIEAIKKGLDDPEVYYQTVDDIIQQRATTAKPLYERFYASPVPFTKKLEDLLGRGSVMRTALRKARDMADAEGVPFKQFFANIAEDGSYTIKRVPDARAWDQIKRSLDDIVSENTQVLPNGAEKLNNFGRVVSNIRREMLDEIDGLAPAYGQARKAYSSASESLEAVTRGGKLLDADPELARRTLSKMTPEDAQLARIGISKALVDRVQKSKDGLNVVRGIFGSPRQRAVLKEAFPSKEAFDEFKATMFREAQKSRTKNAVTGNSTTAQQMTDLADNQMDVGVISNLATGRFGAAAGAIVQKALARATVVNEATAKEIASIITSTDPQVAKQILGQMQQMAARDQRVAQNLANVQNLLRNSGIISGTQQGTQALTPR